MREHRPHEHVEPVPADGPVIDPATDHADHHEARRDRSPNPAGGAASAEDSLAGDTIYTCPMHPQIRRRAPGNCPICGMALEPEMPSLDDESNPELEDFTRRFWWTLPVSVIGVALAMGGHRFMPFPPRTMSWAELVLSTPVVLWAGWPFFVRCVASIRNRSPNMWTLIGIGVASAYVYSVLATVAPGLFPEAFREGGSRRSVLRGGVGHRFADAAWTDAGIACALPHFGRAAFAARPAGENGTQDCS
jgi:cation transport ATPase